MFLLPLICIVLETLFGLTLVVLQISDIAQALTFTPSQGVAQDIIITSIQYIAQETVIT